MKNKYFRIVLFLFIILLFIISILVYIRYSNRIYLTQLGNSSTYQMMGYIIRTKDNKIIVIDGGTKFDSDNLIKNVKKYSNTIDAWYITHPHKDHMGAFTDIVSNNKDININKIYVTLNSLEDIEKYDPGRFEEAKLFYKALENEKVKNKIEEVKLNNIYKIDNITIHILGVKNPELKNAYGNNSSMILKVFNKNKSIMFLGDIGIEGGYKLINNFDGILKSDYVQMSHHGFYGAPDELYKKIKPKYCLWPTVNELWENKEGKFDIEKKKKLMKELNVKKNYIEKDGDITLKIW